MTVGLSPFTAGRIDHQQMLARLWNEACGTDLQVSERLVAYNTQLSEGGAQAGHFVMLDDTPQGFALASTLSGDPQVNASGEGWIDGIAVTPRAQRQGLGTRLLAWAEEWLSEQGCRRVRLGASLRPFAPGVPSELETETFFVRRGYDRLSTVYDMSANLTTYVTPPQVREVAAAARPAQPGQQEDLLAFLRREFPGRWRYEAEQFLRDGGRIADFMLLWTKRGVDGCCLLTFQDSVRPVERHYPYRLPRPWGQVGSIGISGDLRGRGYGMFLLDMALRRLRNNGVHGCVIDWTELVDFYGKFGFTRYREYHCLARDL